MTATVTADFREEYELELTRWLRRRFLWYSGVVLVLSAVSYVILAIFTWLAYTDVLGPETREQMPLQLVSNAVASPGVIYYIWAFVHVRRRVLPREQLLGLVSRLIVVAGVLGLFAPVVGLESTRLFDPEMRAGVGSAIGESPLIGLGGVWGIFISHFFASLFLPWTPRESIRPMVPLILLNAALTFVYGWGRPLEAAGVVALSLLMALPGCVICLWRGSRFRNRFHYRMLRGRYGELRRELQFARELHESLFPRPRREGPIRFEYIYEPMRQIGGDYLYTRTAPDGRLHIVIVDVTGHGISAALAVNRLHGEIDRELAEDPEAGPASLLEGLNRYMNLTMAGHSVYATVLAMQIDLPTSEVRWASAGHPPAFLRAVDGTIHHLDSTSIVLGACRSEDFESEQRTMRFGIGDTIVAYTDGAIESRNAAGKMLGIKGLERMIASGIPQQGAGWAGSVLQAVQEFRDGPAQDDVLIVEVYRPLRLDTESRPTTGPVRRAEAPVAT